MQRRQRNLSRNFFYGNDSASRDYKLAHSEQEIQNNFESTNKWLYLGRQLRNRNFAKIGITTGNLSTRSYSSECPDYHLFCAFKFLWDIPEYKMREIEDSILYAFERKYTYDNKRTKRMCHYESGALSECFQDINFIEFFADLHSEIYNQYRNYFVIVGFENEESQFIDCIFNKKYEKDYLYYINMIKMNDVF